MSVCFGSRALGQVGAHLAQGLLLFRHLDNREHPILRWRGMLGLLGIGTFAGALWLAFRLANPDTGELTGTEITVVLVLVIAGVAIYILGVKPRRGNQIV
jgi:hypothetical protein